MRPELSNSHINFNRHYSRLPGFQHYIESLDGELLYLRSASQYHAFPPLPKLYMFPVDIKFMDPNVEELEIKL